MPEPQTIQRLRGLILSATDLHSMNPEWTDAMIEDYLHHLAGMKVRMFIAVTNPIHEVWTVRLRPCGF